MVFRDLLRGRPAAAPDEQGGWAQALFARQLTPLIARDGGQVLVWTIDDPGAAGTITEQFTAKLHRYSYRRQREHKILWNQA